MFKNPSHGYESFVERYCLRRRKNGDISGKQELLKMAQNAWTNRRATSVEGERPPLPFFENQKKCPDFGKKCPSCVHLLVKFAIQNVVLRVSKRKKLEFFSLWRLFF